MEDLLAIIKKHWGYDGFRPLQREAAASVMAGRDSVVVLPTGGGKSLCFQAPAAILPGLALIVSPLIALMKDQVDALRECGVCAAALNSMTSPEERRFIADAIRGGRLKLLYIAPERLVQPEFIEYIRKYKLSFIAVDEAHCISSWGHDFRPEYRQLRMLREALPDLSIHAYTATASERVREDIARELRLRDPQIIVGSFDRPNLILSAAPLEDSLAQVRAIIDRHRSESGVIYCISRKKVEGLCDALTANGYKAVPYHAGMEADARKANQDAFIQERVDIIVATVAFGMGIDKSNVRYVIHAGMPKSLDHYHQESGRAGRDGLEAECCLLYSPGDLLTWRRILAESESGASEAALGKLDEMYGYCRGATCRHKTLVNYFGEEFDKPNCEACDTCLNNVASVEDSLVLSQKILSCVVRLGERFGAAYTALVLTGSREGRITQNGHDHLSTWGLLANDSKQRVREWIEQLAGQGYLEKVGEYGVLRVTQKGSSALKGADTPRLLLPAVGEVEKAGIAAHSWDGVDRGLFDTLRALRREIAEEKGVPAFVIFDDAALRDMSRHRPCDGDSFREVRGVGERKAGDYGEQFIRAIKDYCAAHSLAMDVPRSRASIPAAPSASSGSKLAAFALFKSGLSIEEVAQKTGRARSTVAGYLADCVALGEITDISPWVDDPTVARIRKAAVDTGGERLRPIFEELGEEVGYDVIRVAMASFAAPSRV